MELKTEFDTEKDRLEIDNLTSRFFSLFTNRGNKIPRVKGIKSIFIKEGLIISNTSGEPLIYNLDSFIKPRAEMLSNGTLTDFSERELSHKTEVFGNIAQRFCLYEKSGKLKGEYFKTEGMKTIQFIKLDQEWKMSSVAWSDKE